MRRVTGRTAEGGPCSILVVDDGPTLTLLLDGILAEHATVSLGKVSALRVPAAVRREMPGHDLALARPADPRRAGPRDGVPAPAV